MASFVDRVVLHATAGNGGHGCSSIHREKFKPLGGPDGANGGNGGDVVLVVDAQVHTRPDFTTIRTRKPATGGPGRASTARAPTGPTSNSECPMAPSSTLRTAPFWLT